jgi:hypothetical protein
MHASKSALFTLFALCLGSCQSLTQPLPAQDAAARSVCIPSYDIDHTDIPNDHTILFTMRDHTVWKNTLQFSCTGLRLDTRGFTYAPTDPGSDSLCSNLVTIHTNTEHNFCQLGAFTKVSGPAHS